MSVDVMPPKSDQKRPLRSLKANRFALVTFVCRTKRKVRVFWIDYKGERIQYTTLSHGDRFPIHTYETHPWLCRDADTGDTLDITVDGDRSPVYFPKAWSGETHQTLAYIDTPVYTLKNICMQAVRNLSKMEDIQLLEIPKDLTRDLLSDKEEVPYRIHLEVNVHE